MDVDLFEKEDTPGGHLKQWYGLFPAGENAREILRRYTDDLTASGIPMHLNSPVISVNRENEHFQVTLREGENSLYRSVILANGFRLFDASRKEEYGYGLYSRVITSPELENMLGKGRESLLIGGKLPEKVAFVHCVGSRDAKVGNHYCSKVCCITGVRQAIAVKELYPSCEVMNFYMDLRMFGMGYEELYQEAQEKYGVIFIRGRVSEAAPTHSGSIQVKAEDTLLSIPVKINVDWLILLTGMEPIPEAASMTENLGLKRDSSGFFEGTDRFRNPGNTSAKGIFMAGACSGPATIPESVSQGKAVACSVLKYLNGTR
jgi:heterodisulfide reductase subunit A